MSDKASAAQQLLQTMKLTERSPQELVSMLNTPGGHLGALAALQRQAFHHLYCRDREALQELSDAFWETSLDSLRDDAILGGFLALQTNVDFALEHYLSENPLRRSPFFLDDSPLDTDFVDFRGLCWSIQSHFEIHRKDTLISADDPGQHHVPPRVARIGWLAIRDGDVANPVKEWTILITDLKKSELAHLAKTARARRNMLEQLREFDLGKEP